MKRGTSEQIVIAAATEVALVDGVPARRVKLLPIGKIVLRDGRGPYMIRDKAHAEQVVAATRAFLGSADFNFDYDHQVAFAAKPGVGGTAVAAGWVKPADLTVQDDGIYADVDWTAAATQKLVAREYRYLSPLFMAAKSGEVLRLTNAALVNIGAIDLPAIAAGFSNDGDTMDLTAIAAALGLPATATVEDIAAAATAVKAKADAPATSMIAVAAGLAADATVEQIAASVTSLKAGQVDLSAYVPLTVVKPMQDQLKKLSSDRLKKQVGDLIAAGVVMPEKEQATLEWFEKDEVAASAFFKDMPAIVQPGALLDGRKPSTKFTTLSADEVAACEMTGMSHEDFLAAKNEGIA